MKTIRKTALILTVLIAVLAFVGCSKQQDNNAGTTAAATSAAPETKTSDVRQDAQTKAYEFPSDRFGTGAVGANGAAACASPLAAQIAVDIMAKGGNAIDAAVGMIYAVGLLEPAASGVGGAGQMTVYLADQNKYVTIEYMTQASGM